MLVRTMTGSENWKNHSAKLLAFHTPTNGMRETPLGVASRDPSSGVRVARAGVPRVAKHGYRPEVGQWTDATYDVPEGACLKLFGNKAGGFGAMNLHANLFVQMREEAALHRVRMYLSQDPNAAFSVVYIEGRFDILSFSDAKTLGVKVLEQFRRLSEPEMINRVFTVEVVEPQTRPRMATEVCMVNVVGETAPVPIVMRRRGRAMQM